MPRLGCPWKMSVEPVRIQPTIVRRLSPVALAVVEGLPADLEAARPIADGVGRHAHAPQCPARPVHVAERFEHRQRALARPPGRLRDRRRVPRRGRGNNSNRPAAPRGRRRARSARRRGNGDGDFRPAAGETVQEPGPVAPGRTPLVVAAGLDERTDRLQSQDVLGLLAEREHHLCLRDHHVDATQPAGGAVGDRLQPPRHRLEVAECGHRWPSVAAVASAASKPYFTASSSRSLRPKW